MFLYLTKECRNGWLVRLVKNLKRSDYSLFTIELHQLNLKGNSRKVCKIKKRTLDK